MQIEMTPKKTPELFRTGDSCHCMNQLETSKQQTKKNLPRTLPRLPFILSTGMQFVWVLALNRQV